MREYVSESEKRAREHMARRACARAEKDARRREREAVLDGVKVLGEAIAFGAIATGFVDAYLYCVGHGIQ